MGKPLTMNLSRRGVVTIPQQLREKYDIAEGDVLTLIDLDGAFVVKPGSLDTDRLAGRVRDQLEEGGESLKSVLKSLREQPEGNGE